jgi:hypothetical protein
MDEPSDEEDFYRPRTSPRTAIPERAVSRSGRGAAADDWSAGPASAGPRDQPPRTGRFGPGGPERESYGNGPRATAYGSSAPSSAADAGPDFGARRRDKDEGRRGSRPMASTAPDDMPRSGRRPGSGPTQPPGAAPLGSRGAVPQGSPISGARSAPAQEPSLGNRTGISNSAPRSNQPPLGRGGSPRPAAGQPIGDAEFRPMRSESGPANPSAERPTGRSESRPSESGPGRSSSPSPSANPGRDNSSRFDD